MSFDIIIVGAGPAGIFCAYELLQHHPKIKIGLVEMGNRLEKRKPNEVMTGFGGAGTYSDGKLHLSAVLSHERVFHLLPKHDYQQLLDYVDTIFTKFGVDSEYFPKDNDTVEKLVENSQKNDIELVVRKVRHVGTDKLYEVMKLFEDYLENKSVTIFDKTLIKDIIVKKGICSGVVTEHNKIIHAKKVLLVPGRISARWIQEISNHYGIQHLHDMVEVGVRVEFPYFVMKHITDIMYEAIFKIRTPSYDDIVRTFCVCPHGFVAAEMYNGSVCVNGHSNSDYSSPNTNFAFLSEVVLTEPVENTMEYAKSLAELTSTIGGGKPILQRLVDLREGRRSTWSRIHKSIVKPSLKEVTPGDISMALPHRIVTNILEGLEKLEQIMPGINSGSTLLYAPEVKYRSTKIKTNKKMETSVKNLFVAGDASGMSGTITGAAATGIMAARGMI